MSSEARALRRPGARAWRRHRTDRGAGRGRGRRTWSASTCPRGCSRSRARRAELAGVELDLRHGDMRDPPVEGEFPLVTASVPLAAAHGDRRRPARGAARGRSATSRPAGASSSTSSRPSKEDIDETHGRWLEREPGIWERADWNEETRTLILHVRGEAGEAEMSLAWLSCPSGRRSSREEGFVVERSTAGSTASRGAAARTRSGSAASGNS